MSERMDDLLFDFWTQLDRTGSADPGALDPTLADTIGHLHDLSLAPVPDATRERIRRKVLDQSVSTEGEPLVTLSAAALPLPSSNGHRKPAPAAPAPRAISTRARPKWAWAMLAAALQCAKEIAAKPPVAIWGTKQVIHYTRDHSVEDSLRQMGWVQGAIWSNAHVREAVSAMKQKRDGQFTPLSPLKRFTDLA